MKWKFLCIFSGCLVGLDEVWSLSGVNINNDFDLVSIIMVLFIVYDVEVYELFDWIW